MTSRSSGEHGQIIILVVLVMTITFVVGAIAVDLALWLSERRGSQTDADFASLAGAMQLLDPNASAADAVQAATDNLTANDEQLNASLAEPILVDDSCFNQGTNDAVTVNVRHSSRALFFEIFGMLNEPDIGAHAKACAGALQSPGEGDLIPFQINDDPGPCFDSAERPIFTSMCPIELGARTGSSSRGMLDLTAPDDYCSANSGGPANIEELIEWGAEGTCLINTAPANPCGNGPWYDCVAIQTGNTQAVLDGTAARIAREGDCDTDGDGTEEFFETVDVVFNTGVPETSIYEARDCDAAPGEQKSPRLVTIVVLEEEPPQGQSNVGRAIVAFAGFYIAGCAAEGVTVNSEADLDPDCTSPGSPPGPRPPNSCGAPGHCVVYGRFVKLIVAGGGVGPPTDQTTLFGISLVE
jgi:hypothetical protein